MVCGKEGPGLLIGMNLGHMFAKKLKRYELNLDDYYFIGASACTSAILKAPISGALFCAELPYSNHIRYPSLLPSIIASSLSYLIFGCFFEFKPLIIVDLIKIGALDFISLLPLLTIFGIITGLIILVFIGIMRAWQSKLKKIFSERRGFWILPLIGGGFYCIFLFISIPFLDPIFTNTLIRPDNSYLSFIVNNTAKFDGISFVVLTVLFIIAIFFSIGFFNSAGMILPLMLLGSLIGGGFGMFFYPEYPELFVLLGISAALGAGVNNPVTAIIIVIEMTWAPILFVPAGIVTIIAYIFSGPKSIVTGQIKVNTIAKVGPQK